MMAGRVRRDALSRAAIRQLAVLGIVATAVFVALMLSLDYASALTGGDSAGGAAFDLETRTITRALSREPPQLDSTRATDTTSFFILGHVMEGLLRYDEQGRIAPGVAERWEIRDDGATFWLRGDARWSDGSPVTADDFVFAWRKLVDPDNAGEYASIIFSIENAEAINAGRLPVESLGVRAAGERRLEVAFEHPVEYFDRLAAFMPLLPVRRAFYSGRDGRYAADADDLLYNGPFKLTQWVHGAHLRLEKNEQYWDRDTVRLDAIDMPYITADTSSTFNLFKDGAIVSTPLGVEQLAEAMKLRLKIGQFTDGFIYYIDFNFRPERATRNDHLRKAMQLVNDTEPFVDQIAALPGLRPGVSFFPAWLPGLDNPFRREHPPPVVEPDIEAARAELLIAKRELGVDEIPPLTLLSTDAPLSRKEAEYYQHLFGRTLGLVIRIDTQNLKQLLDKMTAGDFDLVAIAWGPDYADPLTYGDLYASWNGNNRGLYVNPDLDAEVRIAQMSQDAATRMDAFAEIQRILIEDAVVLPVYENAVDYVQRPELKGVVHRQVGMDTDYRYAYLDESG